MIVATCCLVLGIASAAGEPPPGLAALDAFLARETNAIATRSVERILAGGSWDAKRRELRAELAEMLGLVPEPPRGDVQTRISGTIERADLGFAVDKLSFQPIPGLHISAALFRPLGSAGKHPGVLYLCGHGRVERDGVSYGNKAHYQHHGAWFARSGYVCLIVDTLQLGEIEGKHHGTYRLGQWWWVSRGYTPAGLEAWSSLRALDYLAARPDVDPQRIGVTGRSGGGIGTWWLAALDDRPAAFAPVAGLTDLRNHVLDNCIDGHCDCNFFINTHRWDHTLVAALAAPRPLLILNTDKDRIFPLDGVVRVHETLRRLYAQLGASERLGLCITEGPHADTQDLQVPAFRWLARWLRGEPNQKIALLAEPLLDPTHLRAIDEVPPGEINSSVEETFVAAAPPREPPSSPAEHAAWREDVVARLRATTFRSSPEPAAAAPELIDRRETDGVELARYRLTSEAAFELPLLLAARTGETPRRVVLAVADEAAWRAAGEGALVPATGEARVVLAPRGVGPGRWSDGAERENQIRRRFLALGRTVEEGQVHDVRLAVRAVRALASLHGIPLWLEAEGDLATVAAYAALLEPEVAGLDLTALPVSHRDSVPLLGVLRLLDVPQALAAVLPRPLVLREAAPASFEWTRRAATALEPAGVNELLTFAPARRFVPATAHAIPKHTTSEGSGYFSIVAGKDDRLYVGTARYRENAFLVAFTPGTQRMEVVVDAMKEIGSTATGFAAQAKIHTRNNVGTSGRIYFGTKQGYPKEGEQRSDYAGGHPMVYDPAAGTTRVYPIPVPHQGIISVAPDESRGVAYISTCSDERPVESSHFMVLDLEKGTYRDLLDCRHMYAFIVIDHLGRAYHPVLGGEIARFDPRQGPDGKLERLRQTIDGRAPRGTLLTHPESHPIHWDVSPDRRTLYAVAMSENQLYAHDLAAAGPVLRGRSLGKLLAHAASTDCRALCVGPTGEVWAAVTTSAPESGQLLHVVSWRPGDARPRDHGPLRVANPAYTDFTGSDGKPLPWHHGLRLTGDGTLLPQYPMGICATRDGTVYVTAIYPYTLLAARF